MGKQNQNVMPVDHRREEEIAKLRIKTGVPVFDVGIGSHLTEILGSQVARVCQDIMMQVSSMSPQMVVFAVPLGGQVVDVYVSVFKYRVEIGSRQDTVERIGAEAVKSIDEEWKGKKR